MKHEQSGYFFEEGISGYVTVEYRISEEGYVENSRRVDSTGKVFNKNALKVINSGRFASKVVDGKPVAVEGRRVKINMSVDSFLEYLDELKKEDLPPEEQKRK